MKIKLGREWELGERLGNGLFGQVYVARQGSEEAVAKLIPKTAGPRPRLIFTSLNSARNVVPIIDCGDTADHWAVVMPKARKSLRQYLDEAGGRLDVKEAVPILRDILEALADIDGRLIHGDIKPENILLMERSWCLADFGASLYAATPYHAATAAASSSAPEVSRGEPATRASDIYAVGFLASQLLCGIDEPTASRPDGISREVRALVDECLSESPQERPNAQDLLERLESLKPRRSQGTGTQKAGSCPDRDNAANHTGSRLRGQRQQLFDTALERLRAISDDLQRATLLSVSGSKLVRNEERYWRISAGTAALWLEQPSLLPLSETWDEWPAPFDVLSYTSLGIDTPGEAGSLEGFSHSLWYCDPKQEGNYEWYEAAFRMSPYSLQSTTRVPFALRPGGHAARAFWNGISEWDQAMPLTQIGPGELPAFVERWVSHLKNAKG